MAYAHLAHKLVREDAGGAVTFGDVVMLSVPWRTGDEALSHVGSFDGKIVIDSNQFGPNGVIELPGGISAPEYNARRKLGKPGQGKQHPHSWLSGRSGRAHRASPGVMFSAAEEAFVKQVVAQPIADSGFTAVDLGGWKTVKYR
jgi:predicted dinucleotide-binding enzyme